MVERSLSMGEVRSRVLQAILFVFFCFRFSHSTCFPCIVIVSMPTELLCTIVLLKQAIFFFDMAFSLYLHQASSLRIFVQQGHGRQSVSLRHARQIPSLYPDGSSRFSTFVQTTTWASRYACTVDWQVAVLAYVCVRACMCACMSERLEVPFACSVDVTLLWLVMMLSCILISVSLNISFAVPS